MTYLYNLSSRNSNNLNAIRLFLALSVIFSHSFPVCYGSVREAKCEPVAVWTHGQMTLGSAAVNLFFLLSGMLITASWLRSTSMEDFLMKRVLRIYPAFVIAVGFSGIVIWCFCPEFRMMAGKGLPWLVDMGKDWIFLTHSCLGWNSFAHNPYHDSANASMWTIQPEFQCYLLVAAIGLFCLFRRRVLLLLIFVIIYLCYIRMLFGFNCLGISDCRLLTYFALGVIIWLWRDKIPISGKFALLSLIGLFLSANHKPLFSVLFPIFAVYLTLWVGFAFRLPFFNWTKTTDLSYGTYLYAFPIQQIVAMNPTLRISWVNFLISTPIILIIAWLSWHFIEKDFLAMKKISRYDYDPGSAINKA